MEKKRNSIEIVSDMLTVIQEKRGRIKPTHLMYKANLSHAQLKSYLDDLITKELVKEVPNENNNNYILITDKGCKFLEKLMEMKQFERSFGF